MGCAQSKVDKEETVTRCKERRNVIKEAVTASKAFAAGHFAYVIALKNTGAALSDYGHGESDQTLDVMDQTQFEKQNDRTTNDPPPPQPPPPPLIENFPPPPPPLPKFTPSRIKRTTSLPSMAIRGRKVQTLDSLAIDEEEEEEKEETLPRTESVSDSPANGMAWDYFTTVENMPKPNLDDSEDNNHIQFSEEEEEEEDDEEERSEIFRQISGQIADEPKTPEKVEDDEVVVEEAKKKEKGKAKIEHSNTAPPELRHVIAKTIDSKVNLMSILDEIDDRFLKASECAQGVSKVLEATRLHYHSNFADNRGIEIAFSMIEFGYKVWFFVDWIKF